MDINKSIQAFTNILKLRTTTPEERKRPQDEWWWETGDKKGEANSESPRLPKDYKRPNYNYPRAKGGGTYGEEDTWAMANPGGKLPKGAEWDKRAAALWAKQKWSGITPAYEREAEGTKGKGKPTTTLDEHNVKPHSSKTIQDKQLKHARKTRKNKYSPLGVRMERDVKSGKGATTRRKRKSVKKSILKTDYTGAQKRASERKILNAMRRKSTDMNSYDELKGFWKDNSDTYIKRKPVALNVEKDHALTPPRQGNVWDQVKHRWVSHDNYGKNVTDVQGKAYRSRAGSIGGQGKKTVGGHQGGVQRRVTEGRKHRHFSDTGARTAHERVRATAGRIQRTKRTARKVKTKG